MPTNHESLIRFSGQSGPNISGFIAVDLQEKFFELLSKPVSRFRPYRCKGDPLGAIFIRGERSEFLEFSKCPLRIERRSQSLPAFSSSARIASASALFSKARMKLGFSSLRKKTMIAFRISPS